MKINTFWRQPAEKFTEETRGRTEEELCIREEQTGFKLPAAYRDLMKLQNGGYLRKPAFEYNGKILQFFNGDAWLWKILPEPKGNGNMLDVLSEWMNHDEIIAVSDTAYNFLKRLLIVSGMDGHSYMCLDYGWKEKEVKEEPEVCFFDDDFKEFFRLPNFEEFLKGLRYYGYGSEQYFFGFKGFRSIEEVKKELELQLNFKFERQYTDPPTKYDAYSWYKKYDKWYQGKIKLENDITLILRLSTNEYKSGNFLFQDKKKIKVILGIIPENDVTEISHYNSSKYLKIMRDLLSKSKFYNSIVELLIPLHRDEPSR